MIADDLDPHRRKRFIELSSESLYDIETGYDPFQSELDRTHEADSRPQNQGVSS